MTIYEFVKGTSVIEEMSSDNWIEVKARLAILNHSGGVIVRKKNTKDVYTLEKDTLFVDCFTEGNPGLGGFVIRASDGVKVTDIIKTPKSEHVHTNNYFELLAILEGLKFAKDKSYTKIYSDSNIAMAWVLTQSVGDVAEKKWILEMIRQCRVLMEKNPTIKLIKWDTNRYGDIPADSGRKSNSTPVKVQAI